MLEFGVVWDLYSFRFLGHTRLYPWAVVLKSIIMRHTHLLCILLLLGTCGTLYLVCCLGFPSWWGICWLFCFEALEGVKRQVTWKCAIDYVLLGIWNEYNARLFRDNYLSFNLSQDLIIFLASLWLHLLWGLLGVLYLMWALSFSPCLYSLFYYEHNLVFM